MLSITYKALSGSVRGHLKCPESVRCNFRVTCKPNYSSNLWSGHCVRKKRTLCPFRAKADTVAPLFRGGTVRSLVRRKRKSNAA